DNVLASIARHKQEEGDSGEDSLRFDYSPFDEVTDFLEEHHNFFPTLEERATRFREAAGLGVPVRSEALVEALGRLLGVHTELVEDEGDSSVIWRMEEGERRLVLSRTMIEQRLCFHMAHGAALRIFDEEGLHEPLIA